MNDVRIKIKRGTRLSNAHFVKYMGKVQQGHSLMYRLDTTDVNCKFIKYIEVDAFKTLISLRKEASTTHEYLLLMEGGPDA